MAGASRPEESRRGAGEVEAKRQTQATAGEGENYTTIKQKEKVGGEEGGEEGRDEDQKGEGANKNNTRWKEGVRRKGKVGVVIVRPPPDEYGIHMDH